MFDPHGALSSAAGRLIALADRLQAIQPADEESPSEIAPHDLARALAMWALSFQELETGGTVAWYSMTSMFPKETNNADPFGVERAQLAMLTTWMIGDVVLDAFAWAELIRRRRWSPERRPDGKVPVLWTRLMQVLDAAHDDPMTTPARYLDLTLDAARDMLVAHRDPELALVRGASSNGDFTLELTPVDDARLEAALDVLARLELPWLPVETVHPDRLRARLALERTLDAILAASAGMEAGVRYQVRIAYRHGGFRSPGVVAVSRRLEQLVELHLRVRGA